MNSIPGRAQPGRFEPGAVSTAGGVVSGAFDCNSRSAASFVGEGGTLGSRFCGVPGIMSPGVFEPGKSIDNVTGGIARHRFGTFNCDSVSAIVFVPPPRTDGDFQCDSTTTAVFNGVLSNSYSCASTTTAVFQGELKPQFNCDSVTTATFDPTLPNEFRCDSVTTVEFFVRDGENAGCIVGDEVPDGPQISGYFF